MAKGAGFRLLSVSRSHVRILSPALSYSFGLQPPGSSGTLEGQLSMESPLRDSDHTYNLNFQTLEDSDHLSESNKREIKKYCNKLLSRGVDKSTVSTRISRFHSVFKLVAPNDFELNSATEEDLEEIVARINQLDQHSERTKADYRVVLKDYYKLVQGEKGECPDRAKFIDGGYDEDEVDNKKPLDKSVIQDIIEECQNDRDRAMYKLLYEGGLRPGELMALTIGDIEFLDKGVRIRVPPVKTGERTILVVESERYLKDWLRKHPFEERDDAPLWTKIRNVSNETPTEIALGYDHMRLKLKDIAKEKDILTYWDVERDRHKRPKLDEDGNEKPVKRTEVVPYTLRHSRATHLATELREATMKEYFGWTQGSDMTEVYIHLSGKDIDREIMKMYGIEEEEDETTKKECGRCNKTYKGTENFCPRCGKAFDYEAEIDRDTVKDSSKAVTEQKIEGIEEEKEEKIINKVVKRLKNEEEA